MNVTEKLEDYSFERLDMNDKERLHEYEKGLFAAFYEDNSWYAKKFFIKTGEDSMKPIIAYEDQLIYVALKNNRIIIAMSACNNNKTIYEPERMGFNVDKSSNVCCGLHFFGNLEKKLFIGMNIIYENFMKYVLSDLKRRGYDEIIGYCSQRLFILYRFIGFKIVEKKFIEESNAEEYLIKMKF